jgi:hypothetical protein
MLRLKIPIAIFQLAKLLVDPAFKVAQAGG